MYEEFYGFSRRPFSLLPDADLVFLSTHHRRVANLLECGIVSEAGFVVVSGEVGAGKTTVVRHFLKRLDAGATVGIVSNPSASFERLLVSIAAAFDVPMRDGGGGGVHEAFIAFLLAQYAQGKRAILVIDEAQNLTLETLEELRMLSNVNNEGDLLLQVVLVGQPELLATLKRVELRQFVQRISIHCHLASLDAEETSAYIRYRLNAAGGAVDIFDDLACAAVHLFTGGIPRLINLLCDQALIYGYAEGMTALSFDMIAEAAFDRGRSGLSAFINVPETLCLRTLERDIYTMLGSDTAPVAARMARGQDLV